VRQAVFLALLCTVITGCGQQESEAPPVAPKPAPKKATEQEAGGAKPTPPPPAETTAPKAKDKAPEESKKPPEAPPVAPEEAAPKPAADPFRQKLDEVLALEQEADFAKAFLLARQAKQEFRAHPDVRELDELLYRLKEEKRIAYDLRFAVKSLGTDEPAAVEIARTKLLGAERAGRIFLRLAVRQEPPEVAAAAAGVLAQVRDARMLPFVVERLAKEPRSPLTAALTGAMRALAPQLGTAELAPCLRLLRDEPALGRVDLACALAVVFDEVCKGDREQFNELVQDYLGFDVVRAHVERALVSADEEAVAEVCAHGGSFTSLMEGLRGQYFADQEFTKITLERLDTSIQWNDTRTFPFPDGRQDQVTIRWSGFLQVDTPGDYTFYAAADDRAVVTVGDTIVVDVRGWQETAKAIKLAPGLHPFRIAYHQTDGDARCALTWAGPGIAKTASLPFWVRPWKEWVPKLRAATGSLASEKWEEVRPARATLAAAGEVGRMFLRNAVEEKPDEVARPAIALLAEWGDPRAIPALVARLQKDKEGALATSLMDGLRALARHITREEALRFLEQAKADAACRMVPAAAALCAVLDQVCGGDAEKFNDLVREPGAYEHLESYVANALCSKDAATVARACAFGAPLAPRMQGARGRYYHGEQFDELAFERQDPRIQIDNGQFPFPDKRQDKISAIWTGSVWVEKPGQYTFFVTGDDRVSVSLDGKPVVVSERSQESSGAVNLAKGLHPLEVRHTQLDGDARAIVSWSGPGIERQPLDERVLRTPPWHSYLLKLAEAIKGLASEKEPELAAARAALRLAGPVGCVLLRNAVRYDAETVVPQAVRLLVESGDAQAPAAFVERLKGDPKLAMSPDLTAGLMALVAHVDPEQFAWFHEQIKADAKVEMRPPAAVLCAALDKVCTRDQEKFNALVKDPKGHEQLKAYVEAALASKDAAVVARACEHGAPFAPDMPGLRGRYFHGEHFDQLALEQWDSRISVETGKFPHPGGRQQKISATWTGFLLIGKPADYAFHLTADNRAVLSLDGKPLAESSAGQEQSATAKLAEGPHSLAIRYQQREGGASISLLWSGPEIQKQPLTDSVLRTPPWSGELLKLPDVVRKLASAKEDEIVAARAVLRRAGAVGNVFLRNAVRYEAANVVPQAVRMLVESGDAQAPAAFIERLKGDPKLAMSLDLTAGLTALVEHIDREQFPWFHEQMKADTEKEMRPAAAVLCAALDKVCLRDPQKFSALVKDPKGHEQLKAYVEAALASKDAAVVARACEHGAPFAPDMPGLRGRYFNGEQFDQLVLEQWDSGIQVEDRKFPFPGNRQDKISAAWTGFVLIEKPGDYAFYLTAENWASLSLDGKVLAESAGGQEGTAPAKLASGRHALEVRFRQREGGSRVGLLWSGPEIQKQPLTDSVLRTPPWSGELLKLPDVVRKLASAKEDDLVAARAVLRRAGGVGNVLLRNAVRYEAETVVPQAVRMLVESGDARAPAAFIERLKGDPKLAMSPDLTAGLTALVEHVDPEQFPWFHEQMKADAKKEMRPAAAVLCAALDKVCGRDPEKFDALVKDPKGHEQLKAYVEAALASKDAAAVARACEHGAPFAPYMPGLRGRYFVGEQFDQLVLEQWDSGIQVEDRKFPHPGNRQQKISAAWTGFVLVEKPGDYGFHLAADNRATLFLDGKALVESTGGQEKSAAVKLADGLHPLQVHYHQSQGGARISLSWNGPDIQKQLVPESALRTPPWSAELLKLPDVVRKLASAQAPERLAARATIRRAGPVGNVLLRNAARYEAEKVVAEAARMLVESRDAQAPAAFIERLKGDPKSAMNQDLASGLTALAEHIDPEGLPWLYGQVKQDAKVQMTPPAAVLCAVLDRVCGREAPKFGALVKDPKAHEVLQSYVEAALASKDAVVVARACEHGAPFAPFLPGLRGCYFVGEQFDEPALEQQEPSVYVENRKFPLPGGRQDSIAATWSGFLRIDKPGDYAFHLAADDEATLRIDRQRVVESNGGQEKTGPAKLTEGFHPLAVRYRQRDGNAQISLSWSGQGLDKQRVTDSVLFTTPWPGYLAGLPAAIKALASQKDAEIEVARAALKKAGGVGGVFLRNAVRYEAENVVAQAVRLLADADDEAAPVALLARLREDPTFAMSPSIAEGLAALVARIDAEEFPGLYKAMSEDAKFEMRPAAAALCAAFDVRCKCDAKAFGALVKDPNGRDRLQAYVEKALASKDQAAVHRACAHGAPFAPLVTGLRGRYFEGSDLDKLVLERLDSTVTVENRKFPHPQNRQDKVSATWTGFLLIETPGDYVLYATAEDRARLLVDGKVVVESSAWQEKSGTAKLGKGLHRFRVDFHQTTGNSRLEVQWQGPGINKQRIPSHVFRAAPWDGLLTALTASIAKLASGNVQELATAKATLRAADPVGRLLLRNTLRHGTNPSVVHQAASILVRRRDGEAAPLLIELLKKGPTSPAAPGYMDGLGALSGQIGPQDAAWFYSLPKANAQVDKNRHAAALCAMLETACGGDAQKFSKLVGQPQAYDELKKQVEEALLSKDDKLVAWACEFGGPFAPLMKGLRGQYFEGEHFEKLVLERYDGKIEVGNRAFPHPGNRQDHLSAWWSGFIVVERPGPYVFYSTSDDGDAVWVDGQPVIDGWTGAAGLENKGTIELTRGLHRFEVGCYQVAENGNVAVHWSGPGIGKQVVGDAVLRTRAWAAELQPLPAAVAKLADKDPNERNKARDALKKAAEVGTIYLRNAIRHQTDAIAEEAAKLAKEMGDKEAQPLLEERLKKKPKAP